MSKITQAINSVDLLEAKDLDYATVEELMMLYYSLSRPLGSILLKAMGRKSNNRADGLYRGFKCAICHEEIPDNEDYYACRFGAHAVPECAKCHDDKVRRFEMWCRSQEKGK